MMYLKISVLRKLAEETPLNISPRDAGGWGLFFINAEATLALYSGIYKNNIGR